MGTAGSPITLAGRSVRIRLRVQPGARNPGVKGLVDEADGGVSIRIAVKEPAEGGRANAAVTRMVASALDVPRRAVTVIGGASDRRKLVEVEGGQDDVAERAARWLRTLADDRGGAP